MIFNSIYSMNKADKEAIVYTDSYGNITRLTKEDFANEEEFQKWKDFSDKDYHEQEIADHIERNHTVSIDGLSENCYTTDSAEDTYFYETEQREQEKTSRKLLRALKESTTGTQFRRLEKYYGENMTLDEIEQDEGVSHQQISKSIRLGKDRAEKILKKFSENCPKWGAKKA